MCGLVGFVGAFNDALLERMTRQLAHRGPVELTVGAEQLLAELLDDGRQSRRTLLDHLAGDHVGVDDHRPQLLEHRRDRALA